MWDIDPKYKPDEIEAVRALSIKEILREVELIFRDPIPKRDYSKLMLYLEIANQKLHPHQYDDINYRQ